MSWIHSYALLPTARLREELRPLSVDGRLPRLAEAQLWTAEGVGDHDYAGQQQVEFTEVKLVFLAKLHSMAHSTDDPLDGPAARALVERGPLTEAFFDARWTLEPLGPFTSDQDATLACLEREDMLAVEGPDLPVRSLVAGSESTLRERWLDRATRQGEVRARLTDFFASAIIALCRRFRQTRAAVGANMGLPVADRLHASGIRIQHPCELSIQLEPGGAGVAHRVRFTLFNNAYHPRGGVRSRGYVYGDFRDGTWTLELETIERSSL